MKVDIKLVERLPYSGVACKKWGGWDGLNNQSS